MLQLHIHTQSFCCAVPFGLMGTLHRPNPLRVLHQTAEPVLQLCCLILVEVRYQGRHVVANVNLAGSPGFIVAHYAGPVRPCRHRV